MKKRIPCLRGVGVFLTSFFVCGSGWSVISLSKCPLTFIEPHRGGHQAGGKLIHISSFNPSKSGPSFLKIEGDLLIQNRPTGPFEKLLPWTRKARSVATYGRYLYYFSMGKIYQYDLIFHREMEVGDFTFSENPLLVRKGLNLDSSLEAFFSRGVFYLLEQNRLRIMTLSNAKKGVEKSLTLIPLEQIVRPQKIHPDEAFEFRAADMVKGDLYFLLKSNYRRILPKLYKFDTDKGEVRVDRQITLSNYRTDDRTGHRADGRTISLRVFGEYLFILSGATVTRYSLDYSPAGQTRSLDFEEKSKKYDFDIPLGQLIVDKQHRRLFVREAESYRLWDITSEVIP